MTDRKCSHRTRKMIVFLTLIATLGAIIILNISMGSVSIPIHRIIAILFSGEGTKIEINIIRMIRLPRIAMAVILGGGLSLSGFLLQTFFQNPIAGPFVLGISSGAKMAVAFAMIVFLKISGMISSGVLVAAAFLGALLSTAFILVLSRKLKTMSALLIAGIMIGYICSAATDFLVTFAEDSDIVNLHGWSLGSFSGMSWENVRIAAFIVPLASIAALMLSKQIDAYRLGENYARSIGVNVQAFRVLLILISSILSACVTAFAGPISFVGVAVPYLVKRGLGTAEPLVVIPACFLGGAAFCGACDLIARTVFAPAELNISTVTSFFGAPVVIMMMLMKQKEHA